MTPPSRRDRRSDYRNFPAAYGELFMLCRDGERHTIGPFDAEKAARAAARDLYRYRGFLRTAVETDHDDALARQVHDVARDLKIEVVADLRNVGTDAMFYWYIVLALNPIVAAVARMTTDASLSRRVTVSTPPDDTTDRAEHGVASVSASVCRPVSTSASPPPLDGRDPNHSRVGIFIHHNCWRCKNGEQLDNCPTPSTPGNCGFPQARND